MKNFIRLNKIDNVVTVTKNIKEGFQIENFITKDEIPISHKVSSSKIKKGEAIKKYSQIIGYASRNIEEGEHIHTHNVEFRNTEDDYKLTNDLKEFNYVKEKNRDYFMGYKRDTNVTGTRNYIGIITSVNCSATAAHMIANFFSEKELENYPNVDGVVAFVHGTGCGMAGQGEGFDALQRVMWGYAKHPNHAGILMVGLGCEMNQIDWLLEMYGLKQGALSDNEHSRKPRFKKTVEKGIQIIKEMLPEANKFT